ncbi:MAG: hypothetical protein AB1390_10715, partial [Nitrospirota bacterium]
MKALLQDIEERILSDRYNSLIFDVAGDRDVYLVGGYIRDIFRGIESKDRDFLIGGGLENFVKEINGILEGTVIFFKKGNIRRVVLKNGVTLDFSSPRGTVEEDLSKRDFTINSIAWCPRSSFIDPLNGFDDLKKKLIRCISRQNLVSDPLRIVRAYRFAADLAGFIEKETRNSLKLLHKKVELVASERITLEFFTFLNLAYTSKYLEMALIDGVLQAIFSISDKMLGKNVNLIHKLEKTVFKSLPEDFKVILNKIFSQNISHKGLLCLEALSINGLSIEGKTKLRLSNALRKRLECAHRGTLEMKIAKKMVKKNLFDIFMKSGDAALDVLILSGRVDLIEDHERFKKIWSNGLLGAVDIMGLSNLYRGKRLGNIIMALKKAEFYGRVKTRKEAIDLIRE